MNETVATTNDREEQQMQRKLRQVQANGTGETFVECPAGLWDQVLAAWIRERKNPAPMPIGHRMFINPEEYNSKALAPTSKDKLEALIINQG